MGQLKPGRYVDFEKLEQLINRERCKPERDDKPVGWNAGFNHCCDLLSRELAGMVVAEPARPIMPGDTVECIIVSAAVVKGNAYTVHAITKDMLSLKGIDGWWHADDFRRLGPLPSANAELPRVKREAADRITKVALDKPTGPALLPRVQSDQRVWEVIRDIATTLLNLEDRWTVLLQVSSSTGGLFNWRSSADQPCGPARAAEAMREGYESVFVKKAEPVETPIDFKRFDTDSARDPSVHFEASVPITDEWERIKIGDTLRDGDMINFGCKPKNGLKSIDRASIGEVLQSDGYAHFYRRKADGEAKRIAESFNAQVVPGSTRTYGEHAKPTPKRIARTDAPKDVWQVSPSLAEDGDYDEHEDTEDVYEHVRDVLENYFGDAGEGDSVTIEVRHSALAEPKIEVREFNTEQEVRKHGRDVARQAMGEPASAPSVQLDLAMLRSLTAPNVADEFKVEVVAMDRRDLMRRVVQLSDWVTAYQKCLDGLGLTFTQPLEPRHVHEIVTGLFQSERQAIERARAARWNIERDGDDLLVCFDEHDKGAGCDYVRYVRAGSGKPVAFEDPAETVDPNAYPKWLLERTHVVEYNPNCAKPFMVRLCGKGRGTIDKLPPDASKDDIGYGATLTAAAGAAMRPVSYDDDGKPMQTTAKDLNIDSGTDQFELARSLHRVVRAMHDGHCPACGYLAPSAEFECRCEGFNHLGTGKHSIKIDHVCPACAFTIPADKAAEALGMFHKYMRRNYEAYVKWVESEDGIGVMESAFPDGYDDDEPIDESCFEGWIPSGGGFVSKSRRFLIARRVTYWLLHSCGSSHYHDLIELRTKGELRKVIEALRIE